MVEGVAMHSPIFNLFLILLFVFDRMDHANYPMVAAIQYTYIVMHMIAAATYPLA